jgi:hypothetical protein
MSLPDRFIRTKAVTMIRRMRAIAAIARRVAVPLSLSFILHLPYGACDCSVWRVSPKGGGVRILPLTTYSLIPVELFSN